MITPVTVPEIKLLINNTTGAINEEFMIGDSTETLTLPAGPYLRVEINGLNISIAGQSLSGNFAFEKVTLLGDDHAPGGTGPNADVTITRIELSDVGLRLGTPDRPFVIVSNGHGFLEIVGGANGGVFGEIGATAGRDADVLCKGG